MYFRLTYEVTGYNLPLKEDPLIVSVGGPHEISVFFTHAPVDMQTPNKKADLVQVIARVDPPRKAAAALRDMLNESASAPQVTKRESESSSVVGFDSLSTSLKEFSGNLYGELVDTAIQVFSLIRWRFSLVGPARSYISHNFEWSEDQMTWHVLPRKITWRLTATVQDRLGNRDVTELESLISSGIKEPLSHVLLREARASASLTRSYSSALVMGMAALEIGAKHLIADLVPDAEWLAFQAPTPPIVRIISEYLPTLPSRKLLNGRIIAAPGALIETLNKGVTARNATAHAGLPLPTGEFVERVLDAVSDTLWIFDFYSGNGWAIDHLTSPTKIALGIVQPQEG